MTDRYDVSKLTEAQYEPGSNEEVLKNLVGITDPQEMDKLEAKALAKAADFLIRKYDEDHQFTAGDICQMHKLWLGEIFEWAGKYRRVNVTKNGFTFAMANRVRELMEHFERDQLVRLTPCKNMSRRDLVEAMAEVHVEFELIHPFREGNGRVGRLLTMLMALQAGYPILSYDLIVAERKEDYFSAIQKGLDRDYKPMQDLFENIIENSLASSQGE